MRTGGSTVEYMPQLDGLRAIAAGGVIVEHWASGFRPLLRDLVQSLDLGGWGVECFFVLSGFLITLILLDIKGQKLPFLSGLGHFYVRRALRILPAYYATLIVVGFVSADMRSVIWWHALYLTDLYPLWHDSWPSAGGHFWSLAVEEQFYLFWPLIVLVTRLRTIKILALALCVIAPVSRLIIWHAVGPADQIVIYTFPTTALDLLGLGALLACHRRQGDQSASSAFTRWLRGIGLAALLSYIVLYFHFRNSLLLAVFDRTLLAVFFGALVVSAANGLGGPLGWLVGSRFIVWLGTISYGLYVFHPFVTDLYVHLRNVLELSDEHFGVYYIRYPLLTMLLLLVTSASYYLLERPVRAFRRYF